MKMLGQNRAIPKVARVFSIAFALASLASEAKAAKICVLAGDSLGLQAALATAASNNEDDLIMLQAGAYDLPLNFGLSYYPSIAEQGNLTIAGGYHENADNTDPCGGIQSLDARDTAINGGQLFLGMPDGASSLALVGFTISGMVGAGKRVLVGGSGNWMGSLTIDRMIFKGNGSTDDDAVWLSTSGGALVISNSVFDQNASFAGYNAVRIYNPRPDDSFCTEIIHSTFARNAASVPAIGIGGSGILEPCTPLVANSVFWGNDTGQIEINFPAVGYFLDVDVTDLGELSGMAVTNAFSIDPMFNADLSIGDMSPLREAGTVGGLFSNGAYDVIGSPRIYGQRPDIGAFELQDVIFAHPFDWQIPSP
jgi:hypothetical protein